MKLFLDSANLIEIAESVHLGLVEGVTTNPTLIKREVNVGKKSKKKTNLDEHLTEIFVTVKGPVSIEVTKTDSVGMTNEGKKLYDRYNILSNNAFIKVPINTSLNGKTKVTEGLKAVRALSHARVPVNCTLIFTPEQALLAAKAGARYISLYVGRVDDFIRSNNKFEFEKSDYYPAEGMNGWNDNGIVSGVDLVRKTAELFRLHGIKAEILAASIRNARQLREVALAGANIATAPFQVLMDSLNHEKTQEGIKLFTNDIVPEYAKLADKK